MRFWDKKHYGLADDVIRRAFDQFCACLIDVTDNAAGIDHHNPLSLIFNQETVALLTDPQCILDFVMMANIGEIAKQVWIGFGMIKIPSALHFYGNQSAGPRG